jgi:hypothetical protein
LRRRYLRGALMKKLCRREMLRGDLRGYHRSYVCEGECMHTALGRPSFFETCVFFSGWARIFRVAASKTGAGSGAWSALKPACSVHFPNKWMGGSIHFPNNWMGGQGYHVVHPIHNLEIWMGLQVFVKGFATL